MKVKFYGTGAGYGLPEIFCGCRICEYARMHGGKDVRSRSQAVIDDCLGVEFPVDAFLHSAYHGLRMREVKHILITHGHHDHFLPHDAFGRPQNVVTAHFYASPETGDQIREIIERQSPEEKPNVQKRLKVHDLEHYQTYDILGYQITPVRARHHEKLGSNLFIIRKDGKSVFWAYDTGRFHEDVFEYIEKNGEHFDMVVLDCTMKKDEQIVTAHMDITWCAEMKKKLQEMGAITDRSRIFLSHIGHLVDCTHEELCTLAAEYGMEVAYDGLEVTI